MRPEIGIRVPKKDPLVAKGVARRIDRLPSLQLETRGGRSAQMAKYGDMRDSGTHRLRRLADDCVEQRGCLSQVPGTRVQARELEPRGCTESRTVRRMFEMPAGAGVVVEQAAARGRCSTRSPRRCSRVRRPRSGAAPLPRDASVAAPGGQSPCAARRSQGIARAPRRTRGTPRAGGRRARRGYRSRRSAPHWPELVVAAGMTAADRAGCPSRG